MKIGDLKILEREDIYGSDTTVYMKRLLIVACKSFSVRIHKFIRSDHDVLHDHPWSFVTLILKGGYFEETEGGPSGVCHCGESMRHHTQMDNHTPKDMPLIQSKWYGPGTVRFVTAETKHRVRLDLKEEDCEFPGCGHTKNNPCPELPCWTFIITGPVRRKWGFWCPSGFIGWKDFLGKLKGICSS